MNWKYFVETKIRISNLRVVGFSKNIVPSRELTYPPKNGILKMTFLFPRWDTLIPWRVRFLQLLQEKKNTSSSF